MGRRPGRGRAARLSQHLRRQRRRRLLDGLIGRLAPRGEIVLAGFYSAPLSFISRRPSCARRGCASRRNGTRRDLPQSCALIESGELSLDGLITHHSGAARRDACLPDRIQRSACLKMFLDWRNAA